MNKQIVVGMTWFKDGHLFTVNEVFDDVKCSITEEWISEDTGEEITDTRLYNIDCDDNGSFVWRDEYREYAFNSLEENGYYWWARMYACGAIDLTLDRDIL